MSESVVFDLFGTLVPKWDSRISIETRMRMATLLDIPGEEFGNLWAESFWDRELGRTTTREAMSRIARRLRRGLTEARIDEAHAVWSDLVKSMVRPRNFAVAATLDRLRSRGYRIGLISNCGPEVPGVFHRSTLAALVDHATFSCEIGIAKPDRSIYEIHCRDLGVDRERTIFIGDGGSDELAGAARAGLTAIFLRVEDEIAREGLPEGLDRWQGPSIGDIAHLLEHLP
jgi:putative hydrolase of the HAD superfamily